MPAFFILFLLTAVGGAILYALVRANEHEQRHRKRPSLLSLEVPLATRMTRVASQLPQGRRRRTGHRQVVEGRIFGREISIESRGNEVLYCLVAPRLNNWSLGFNAQAGSFEVDYPGDTLGVDFASRLVLDPKAKRALSSLTQDQGLSELELRDGLLSARGPGARLTPSRAKRIFRDLHHLAHAAEGLPLQAPTQPSSDKEIDWSTRTCPYCRDDLAEASRVACERCQTVHHEECFEELGRCTTAACDGTRGFPVTQTHERAKVVIGAGGCNECGLRGQGCRPGACQAGSFDRALHRRRGLRRSRRVGS